MPDDRTASVPEPRLEDVGLLGAVRAFGIMSGGPVVGLLAAGAGVVATARALSRRRRPSFLAIVPVAALLTWLAVLRPWSRRWGVTAAEAAATLPGDELVDDPAIVMTRAVTIDAPVDEVWAWLAQIGQDRAGFYSYAWLENLAGCRLANADRINPEWQRRVVGETVLLHPANGLRLARFEPGRAYAFEGGWCFALEPLDAGRTRLYARTRVPRGWPSLGYAVAIELPHFIMERRMLLGIKARAER